MNFSDYIRHRGYGSINDAYKDLKRLKEEYKKDVKNKHLFKYKLKFDSGYKVLKEDIQEETGITDKTFYKWQKKGLIKIFSKNNIYTITY